MKKKLFSCVMVLMGILLFSSCANDDVANVDKTANYNANFENVFGVINPAQNFNTQRTVTIDATVVNSKGSYTLLVYDGNPSTKSASLVGKFENLNPSSSTVQVGVSKTTKSIYFVADDGTSRSLTSASLPASGRVSAKFDITGGTPAGETTEEASSVSIAFEDLGSTDDFDFNDAVIKVDYVTGTGVAKVTLMAVGAVLPLKLYYTDLRSVTPLFEGEELHKVMGFDNLSTMINTNWKTKDGVEGKDNIPFVTCEIAVPNEFFISEDGVPFILEVDGVQEQRKITASTEYGAVPQVLVVGKYYKEDEAKTFFWRWPKERVRLNLGFPEIGNWMSNPEDLSFLANGVEKNLYNGYNPTIEGDVYERPENLEAIDLGLPSGTLWANLNMGATVPEEYGGFYAWGETTVKDFYAWSNYTYCDGSYNTCYDIGEDIAGTNYDVAHVKWGGNWCMPTYDQIQELLDYCTSKWTTLNGVKGKLFTGENGNSIFLPAVGYSWNNEHGEEGEFGYYWSSTLCMDPYGAYYLSFRKQNDRINHYRRGYGRSVRAVTK